MSWLLDADILSQPAKRRGDPRVIAWLEREEARCHTSAIVIAQLAYWVRAKEGKQREALQKWLRQLLDAMEGRVLGFSMAVAQVWGSATGLRPGRAANAAGRQLHRRDGTPPRTDDRDPERPRLSTAGRDGPESLQGVAQFKDADGHTLKANLDDRGLSAEEHLGQLLFYDGDELRPCRDRRTLAATSPHNSVVFVCSAAFKSAIERNHRLVESILINEMLHTLGLRENPPTSREITNRVDEACR